ncbi:MAG: hypothetical protein R8G66_34510 [Cytophagales bacterium]|nr:hypothetical protein [Cytophagales bacterium]
MASFKSILYRYHVESFLIIFLGSVLLTSINHTHDWGGDFAQYMNNASDLINGTKTQQQEILDHENFTPLSRGAGFSLLLAALYPVFQDSIAPYTIFISLCLIIASIGLFQFFKKEGLSPWLSLAMVLIFVLHPLVVVQRMEILPTFPFLILLFIGFSIVDQSSKKSILLLGMVVGLMISFRNVGWVFMAALFIHEGIDLLKSFHWQKVFRVLLIVIVSQVVDLLIKWIVFGQLSFENLSWYDSVFTPAQMWLKVQENFFYYYDLIHLFFRQYLVQVNHTLYEKAFLALVLLGFLSRLRSWKLYDTFFLLYLALILTYFWQSGMRFLVPVLPIILGYLGSGMKWLLSKFIKEEHPRWLVFSLCLPIIFLIGQANESMAAIQQAKSTVPGPQSPAAIEAFDFIRRHTDPAQSIAFHKPWVLHHYTGRVSMAINPKNGIEGFSMSYLVDKMQRFKVDYLLISIDPKDVAIYNQTLVSAISGDTRLTERRRNDAFVFFVIENKD